MYTQRIWEMDHLRDILLDCFALVKIELGLHCRLLRVSLMTFRSIFLETRQDFVPLQRV